MTSFSYSQLLCSRADDEPTPAHGLPDLPAHHTRCLVAGPPGSSLASIALQYSANRALRTPGSTVVFLCRRNVVEERLHPLPPAADQAAQREALSRVKMRYLISHVELQQYAACMHMLEPPPVAVVVHHLASFFSGPAMDRRMKEVQLARTLAVLTDAVDSFRHRSPEPCPLLVTVEDAGMATGGSLDLLYIMQRWLPLVLQASQNGGGPVWTLGVYGHCPAAAGLPLALQHTRVAYRSEGDVLTVDLMPV